MHDYVIRILLLLASIIFPIVSIGQDQLTRKEDSESEAASVAIPKILLAPSSEEEEAQHDILVAISQRDYKLAEQLFEIASQDDDRKQLIATANFGSQLRGLTSFWRSIEAGLQRVKEGDQVALSAQLIARDTELTTWHSQQAESERTSGPASKPAKAADRDIVMVRVSEKSEFSLTLTNPDHGTIEVPTKQNEMPTALAVGLFRFQFPNSAISATALFERFDFPGDQRLASANSSTSPNSAEMERTGSISQAENQGDDKEAKSNTSSVSVKKNDTRLPVPSDADQKKSRLEIRRLFDTLYTGKTPQNIQERARKLMQVAKETDPKANATDLYILLGEALNAAESIADIDLSLSISSEIASRFQVDPHAIFIGTAKNVLSKVREPSSAESMLGEIRLKVEGWIENDNYALAKKALTELSPAIKRLRLSHWITYVGDEQNRIRLLSKKYSELVAIVGNTSSAQVQAQANEASQANWPLPEKLSESQCELIARFIIFDKGNLEKGLPYLSRASSENLREIAKLELKPPQNAEERILLAEKWLEIKDQPFASQRARSIYSEILLTSTGLTEARVRKKLEEIQDTTGKSPSIRDYIGKTFKITWIYIDGSGSKDEAETLVFKPDGTYRREQPAGALEGTWTELLGGEISTKITTRTGCSEGFRLLPGGFISGMHYRGDKPVARCQGQVSVQP